VFKAFWWRKQMKTITSFLAVMLLMSPGVFAQRITGAIEGRVTDVSGAVLPGVEITVTNEATGQARETLTNEAGLYNAPLLPSGTYSVKAALSGFRTELRRGIQVEVDRNARVEFQMQVGAMTESMEVVADAPLVQIDTSALGQVIDRQRVADLPLNGRDFLSLATLTPGVQPNVEGSNLSTQQGSVNVNGAREEFNNFLLDGVDNNDVGNAQLIVVPGIDSIQEFKVQTSNYSAEYGRAAGGLVNVSTKAGDNSFHGSAYGFLRHSALDARNFFADPTKPKPPFERNQWGGTLGGPIVTNKTFFFGSYERTDIRQAQSATALVPPAEWRNGNFSTVSAAIIDPSTGQQFPGNIITSQRINRIGKALLDLFPLPNSSGANNLITTSNFTSYTDNVATRLDHQLGTSDTIFGRYSLWYQDRLEPFSRSPTTIPGYGQFLETKSHSLAINETHIFSANVVNEFRLGYTRVLGGLYDEQRGQDTRQYVNALGLKSVRMVTDPDFPDYLTQLPVVQPTGYNFLQAGSPQRRVDNHFNYVDNLAFSKGVHKIRVGFEGKRTQLNLLRTDPSAGLYRFEGRYTGNPIADMLLGYPTMTQREVGDIFSYERSWHFSGYFQDDWRVNSKLTLNLGLRYEFQTAGYDKYDRKASFQPSRGVTVLVGEGAVPADVVPILAKFPGFALKDGSVPRGGFRNDYNNFGPRLGFAYDMGGDGRTVIRGGAGTFYIPVLANKTHGYKRTFPFVFRDTVLASTDARNPNVSLDNAFPEDLLNSAITAGGVDPDMKISYMFQANLNVQHEINKATVVEIGYSGSKGNSLTRTRNVNQAMIGAGAINDRRPFPKFANISWLEASANSNYHSMQLRLDRRLLSGFSTLGSYTWSKSIDDNSGSGGLAEGSQPQNNYDLKAERGPSTFDRTHRLTAAILWSPNLGARITGPAAVVVKGWQFNGIYLFSTGQPFTPGVSRDNSLTGQSQDRPILVGDPTLDNPDPARWVNPAAFRLASLGQYGNAGRNILRGPGQNNFDLSVFKSFAYREIPDFLQFRAEFFNAFNHPQFFLPNRFVDNAAFGTISRARDGRDIQLALRLHF
jgi:hypothetical protein